MRNQNYYQNTNTKPKGLIIGLIVILSGIIIAALALLVINVILPGMKSSTFSILVAPSSAVVKIDGEVYENGEYKFMPGSYSVEVSAAGFKTYSEKITAKANETVNIKTILEPNDDNSDYYDEHPAEDAYAEMVFNRKVEAEEAALRTDPIWKHTPYHDDDNGFYIDPSFDSENNLSVTITILSCIASRQEEQKAQAEAWFKDRSLNISKYNVSYITNCKN